MKTYCINGTWCRYFIAGDVYVSKDGTVAGKPAYKGKGCKPLSIIEDEGKKYIQVSKNNLVPVDLAVMICYCPPKPNDGKRYTINHKDGDLLNCAASNLEWVIQPYVHTAEDSFDQKVSAGIFIFFIPLKSRVPKEENKGRYITKQQGYYHYHRKDSLCFTDQFYNRLRYKKSSTGTLFE